MEGTGGGCGLADGKNGGQYEREGQPQRAAPLINWPTELIMLQ